ncbi:MAG: flavodoxin [Gammaproteobacteria bacterium RIFCSPLOWO2_02_FULL_61_13]|nr:MAG: flavodoxin [Gammaproteobacteria bacterium RIFCSPLOWO2_02_FULL_61_13]
MPNLLIVAHAPSDNTRILLDAVVRGASHPDINAVALRIKAPLEAGPDDLIWAQGLILGTTENFGSMAGLMKDFLERIYYPCLEKTQGLPYALYIRAGNDGLGTRTAMERIISGLRWQPAQPPLLLAGEFHPGFAASCEELGQTMAAGLEAGVF